MNWRYCSHFSLSRTTNDAKQGPHSVMGSRQWWSLWYVERTVGVSESVVLSPLRSHEHHTNCRSACRHLPLDCQETGGHQRELDYERRLHAAVRMALVSNWCQPFIFSVCDLTSSITRRITRRKWEEIFPLRTGSWLGRYLPRLSSLFSLSLMCLRAVSCS